MITPEADRSQVHLFYFSALILTRNPCYWLTEGERASEVKVETGDAFFTCTPVRVSRQSS